MRTIIIFFITHCVGIVSTKQGAQLHITDHELPVGTLFCYGGIN